MSTMPAPGLLVGYSEGHHDVCWNPTEHRHLVIIGEPGTGKTTLAMGIAREAAVDNEANVWVVEPYRTSHAVAYAPLGAWLARARFGYGTLPVIADLATSGAQGYLVVEDPGTASMAPSKTTDFEEALDLAAKANGLHLILVTADPVRADHLISLGASCVTLGTVGLRPGFVNFHPGPVEPRVTVRPQWTSPEEIAESLRTLS